MVHWDWGESSARFLPSGEHPAQGKGGGMKGGPLLEAADTMRESYINTAHYVTLEQPAKVS